MAFQRRLTPEERKQMKRLGHKSVTLIRPVRKLKVPRSQETEAVVPQSAPPPKGGHEDVRSLPPFEQEGILNDFEAPASKRLVAAKCLGFEVVGGGQAFVLVFHKRRNIRIRIQK